MAYIEGTTIGNGSHMATAKNGQKYVTAPKVDEFAHKSSQTYDDDWEYDAQGRKVRRKSAGTGAVATAAAAPAAAAAPSVDLNAVWMAYLNDLKAQAQAAYDRNMARISDSYNQGASTLSSNLSSSMDQLSRARDASNLGITRDAESSLKSAYINNMMARRDMRQNMSAQGLNGGAAESTMASLANNYGTSRNNIETTRNRSLEELERTYNSNVAQAQQAYNSALANLYAQKMQQEQQAENALTNFQSGYAANLSSLATSNADFLNALSGAVANQQAFTYDPTQATNIYNGVDLTQAAMGNDGNAYAQYLAQQQLQAQQTNALRAQLQAQGYNNAAINQYFAQIGLR